MSSPGEENPDGSVDHARSEGGRTGSPEREDPPPSRSEWSTTESRDEPPPAETGDDENGWKLFAYDLASSVLAVLAIGMYLFAISGVWPPLVAVESASMVPNMQINDLVFVMEADRFPGEGAHDTGVVTTQTGRTVEYRSFDGYGDVIVFERNGNADRVPIIHRARFWVEASENWYPRANGDYVAGADACETDSDPDTDTGLRNCPAPHQGFVTKGDANSNYDQATGLSEPVKARWLIGTAEARIPGLGWIRLQSQS